MYSDAAVFSYWATIGVKAIMIMKKFCTRKELRIIVEAKSPTTMLALL